MTKKTFVEAIREALAEELRRDERVFLMGEDIGVFGGPLKATLGLIQEFGSERIMETPITESAFVGAGVGSAMTGMRPVVEIMFFDFVTVCMDMIANQAAKLRYMYGGQVEVPLVVRSQQGGGVGAAAQHSQCLEAWVAHVPGLKVVMPSTPADAKGLLKTAIRDNNPIVFLEHKRLYGMSGDVPDNEHLIPFGVADIKRPGKDVTVVATSYMVHKALEAANIIASEGIEAEVIDPRTIVPLDIDSIIKSVQKTGRLVIVHEAVKSFGVGAEIAAQVSEQALEYLDAPIIRVGALNAPVPLSQPEEEAVLPSTDRIVSAIRQSFDE